jgi:GntR family transcriptional repressor for pyruvate dehydrogenase complex
MRLLIGEIVAGQLGAGEMLPRETDLADQFGVSRGVAREIIRGLEERGLVKVTHGRGATVTKPESWEVFDPDVLASVLHGERAAVFLDHYLECRRILEVEAAALAAKRADRDELETLERAFVAMEEAAIRADRNPAAEDLYIEADIAFHRAIVACSGNPALGRMTEPLHRALSTAMPHFTRPRARLERALPEHRRILESILGGDPEEAREAMRAHLSTVGGYLAEYAQTLAQPRTKRRRPASARAGS